MRMRVAAAALVAAAVVAAAVVSGAGEARALDVPEGRAARVAVAGSGVRAALLGAALREVLGDEADIMLTTGVENVDGWVTSRQSSSQARRAYEHVYGAPGGALDRFLEGREDARPCADLHFMPGSGEGAHALLWDGQKRLHSLDDAKKTGKEEGHWTALSNLRRAFVARAEADADPTEAPRDLGGWVHLVTRAVAQLTEEQRTSGVHFERGEDLLRHLNARFPFIANTSITNFLQQHGLDSPENTELVGFATSLAYMQGREAHAFAGLLALSHLVANTPDGKQREGGPVCFEVNNITEMILEHAGVKVNITRRPLSFLNESAPHKFLAFARGAKVVGMDLDAVVIADPSETNPQIGAISSGTGFRLRNKKITGGRRSKMQHYDSPTRLHLFRNMQHISFVMGTLELADAGGTETGEDEVPFYTLPDESATPEDARKGGLVLVSEDAPLEFVSIQRMAHKDATLSDQGRVHVEPDSAQTDIERMLKEQKEKIAAATDASHAQPRTGASRKRRRNAQVVGIDAGPNATLYRIVSEEAISDEALASLFPYGFEVLHEYAHDPMHAPRDLEPRVSTTDAWQQPASFFHGTGADETLPILWGDMALTMGPTHDFEAVAAMNTALLVGRHLGVVEAPSKSEAAAQQPNTSSETQEEVQGPTKKDNENAAGSEVNDKATEAEAVLQALREKHGAQEESSALVIVEQPDEDDANDDRDPRIKAAENRRRKRGAARLAEKQKQGGGAASGEQVEL